MLKRIKYFFKNFISSRTFLLYVLFVALGFVLINRIFQLQIIEGADKQTELELKIKKERSIASTRGNIYDCNGNILAYNELSHSVTIEDVYESGSQKNAQLNGTLKQVLEILWENGDDVSYDFHIYLDENGDFAFTIYDEEGRVYTETADYFQCPQEPGVYLVCEEFYWGTSQENIGMEYYFWIEVTEEYLASEK